MPRKSKDSEGSKSTKDTPANEPWNNQFEDDLDESGNFSRIKKRKTSRGNSTLTWVLIVLIVLICLTPIIWKAVYNRMENNADTATHISVSTSSSSAKELSSKSSEKSSSSSQKSSSSSQAVSSSSTPASSSSTSAVSSSSVSSSSASSVSSSSASSSSSSSTAAGSYTVQSGDNLYRIAVNHGMTLSEIQELNGMGTSTSITPGQTIKVK